MRLWPVALMMAVAASGQHPGPPPKPVPPPKITYRAQIKLEGDLPLPTTPLVLVLHEGKVIWGCRITHIFGNGTVVYDISPYDTLDPPDPTLGIPDDCHVDIRLDGYESTRATLHDGGIVLLRRAGAHEGSSVSASSLAVPREAKKAYAKGVAAAAKQKWAESQVFLEQALALYRDYAPAWTDLGEAQKAQAKLSDARTSYDEALKADPKYVRAYIQAARLALDDGRHQDGLKLSDSAISLDSTGFPEAYFYRAVADYNLGHLDAAEASVRRAIELDINHQLPRAEHLLGCVLARQGDFGAALDHLRQYVRISPLATDTVETLILIRTLETIGPTP